jgi:hypothetical protein
MMLDYYRSQPHPTYPTVTAGTFHDTQMKASLYSTRYENRLPFDSEVARLAILGAGPKELDDHYSNIGGPKPQPQQQPMQVIQGGAADAAERPR